MEHCLPPPFRYFLLLHWLFLPLTVVSYSRVCQLYGTVNKRKQSEYNIQYCDEAKLIVPYQPSDFARYVYPMTLRRL